MDKKIIIKINTVHNYYIIPIYRALKYVEKKFNFIVKDTGSIPNYSITVNNKIVAYISHRDGFAFHRKGDLADIQKIDYKRIFKFHYSPNLFDYSIYGKYENRIVPCGLYRWWENTKFDKKNLLIRKRPIDVVALMAWYNRGTPANSGKAWAIARRTIITQAKNLHKNGYNIRAGRKIEKKQYEKLLLNTKIGFLWSASAYLGWKIPEFTQQGVVMITEPLGKNYPLINGVIFKDGIHCIFCKNPNDFEKEAIKLLKDKKRLEYLRKNILELWKNKLLPEKIGEWYYKKIIETYKEI